MRKEMNDFTIHISANNPTLALTLSVPFSLSRHLNLSFAKLSTTRNQNLNIKKGRLREGFLRLLTSLSITRFSTKAYKLTTCFGPTCFGPDLY